MNPSTKVTVAAAQFASHGGMERLDRRAGVKLEAAPQAGGEQFQVRCGDVGKPGEVGDEMSCRHTGAAVDLLALGPAGSFAGGVKLIFHDGRSDANPTANCIAEFIVPPARP